MMGRDVEQGDFAGSHKPYHEKAALQRYLRQPWEPVMSLNEKSEPWMQELYETGFPVAASGIPCGSMQGCSCN